MYNRFEEYSMTEYRHMKEEEAARHRFVQEVRRQRNGGELPPGLPARIGATLAGLLPRGLLARRSERRAQPSTDQAQRPA